MVGKRLSFAVAGAACKSQLGVAPPDPQPSLRSGGLLPHPGTSPSSKAAAGKMNLYESFAQATQLGDLHTCLMMDMKACQEDDVRLLCYLTPSIYTEVRPPPGAGDPGSDAQGIPSPSCGAGLVCFGACHAAAEKPESLEKAVSG